MNVGFIGMGNMAQALAEGFVTSKKIQAENIFAFAPNQEKLKANAKRIGFVPCVSAAEVSEKCGVIILACKPYQIQGVLKENGFKNKALVSVAAGWAFGSFQKFSPEFRVLCVMPNTPAMAGEGVFLFEKNHSLTEEEFSFVKNLFAPLGTTESVPSELMGIGGAISGCGPAFMDMIMEAYADAAVKYGMPRELAYRIVSQTMKGSAALQQKTGLHPGVLKDAVCSPGGTTIKGVSSLEKSGIRDACISSIDAIMKV